MQKTLSYDQARELKWFCQNVMGTRQEFYAVMDQANAFDARLQRLEKTCAAIEKFLGVKIEAQPAVDWNAEQPGGAQ